MPCFTCSTLNKYSVSVLVFCIWCFRCRPKQCPFLSGRLTDFVMISEEHLKNDEISFQNVYDHMESVN